MSFQTWWLHASSISCSHSAYNFKLMLMWNTTNFLLCIIQKLCNLNSHKLENPIIYLSIYFHVISTYLKINCFRTSVSCSRSTGTGGREVLCSPVNWGIQPMAHTSGGIRTTLLRAGTLPTPMVIPLKRDQAWRSTLRHYVKCIILPTWTKRRKKRKRIM